MLATLQLLILLIVANGTPQVARTLLGSRLNYPVDCGITLADGKRLFGDSKTWRGVMSALGFCALAAYLLGASALFGVAVAAGAMLGDLISSFVKRRLGFSSSAKATVLDQVPESVLPALLAIYYFNFAWLSAIVAALVFVLLDIVLSPLLFKLGIRQVPH